MISPFLRMVLLALLLFALAAAAATTYDYVIVGGGTNGLVLANRLSENPSVSVAVVEAGESVLNNNNVKDTGGYLRASGSSIDWQYQTTKQQYGGDKQYILHAAKAIGGKSTINGKGSFQAPICPVGLD